MARDTDTGEQARSLLILTWSGVAGVIGGLAGFLVASLNGWSTLPTILAGFVIAASALYLAVTVFSNAAGSAAATLYVPAGRGTPPRREYSRAESLVARARFDEAAAAYRQHAEDDPEDPEPVLRLGRLCRDRLHRYEDAVVHFRRAREIAADPGIRHLAVRELIEVLVIRMGQPERALPELARLAEENAGTAIGEWARAELGRLKSELNG